MVKVDIDRNPKLELPEPSAEGLQDVIAEAAATKSAIREIFGDEPGKLDPEDAAIVEKLAIKQAVIIWVLEKVLPHQVLGLSWDRRVDAEISGPLGLHMTRKEILDHLRFEADAGKYIFEEEN